MDENAVVNLVAIETATPRRQIAHSAGAIYVALIALIIGCITIGNLLYANWQIPRHFTQPILYGMIAICGFFIYQRHYLRYRYTLTDEMFAIERISGNGELTIVAVSLQDIHRICDYEIGKSTQKNIIHASLPPRKNATWITAQVNEKEINYTISASEEFVIKLTEQWHRLSTPQDDSIT